MAAGEYWVPLAFLLPAVGCLSVPNTSDANATCATSADCDALNAGDRCEETGACSTTDTDCADSGRRYRVSGQCLTGCVSSAVCDDLNTGDLCEQTSQCSAADSGCESGRRHRVTGGCADLPPDPIGAWGNVTTQNWPDVLFNHATVVAGDALYVLGGFRFGGHEKSWVRETPSASWVPTTPIPRGSLAAAAAVKGTTIFLVGGNEDGGTTLDEVLSAPILSGGQIGAWTATTSLPFRLEGHGMVVRGDFLYAAGGRLTTSTASNTVLVSQITGEEAGGWRNEGAFVGPRIGLAALVHSGSLYVIGGCGTAIGGDCGHEIDEALADVQVATMSDDGTLGPFRAVAGLVRARSSHAAVVVNDHLMVFGGAVGPTPVGTNPQTLNDGEFAFVHPDGTLGPWRTLSGTFFDSRRLLRVDRIGDDLWLTGGVDDSAVQQARIR